MCTGACGSVGRVGCPTARKLADCSLALLESLSVIWQDTLLCKKKEKKERNQSLRGSQVQCFHSISTKLGQMTVRKGIISKTYTKSICRL